MLQFATAFTFFVKADLRGTTRARPYSLHAIYSHGHDHLRKRSLQVYIAFTLHVMNFFTVYNTIRIAQIVQVGGDVRNIFEFAAEKLGTLAAL